jgi:hypothetical protein
MPRIQTYIVEPREEARTRFVIEDLCGPMGRSVLARAPQQRDPIAFLQPAEAARVGHLFPGHVVVKPIPTGR